MFSGLTGTAAKLLFKKTAFSPSSSFYRRTVASSAVFRLAGVYPSVVTPFNEKLEEIDYGRFELLLRHLNRFPFAGFALLGSSGEFASISNDKKLELLKFARGDLGMHRTIIVGAGTESTTETIDLVKNMGSVGADAVFVFNPTYFRDRLDHEAYVEHFTKIADNSPIPVILYNIPAHLDVDIPIGVVCELAKHHNIAGLLDTGGNITRIATICMKTRHLSDKFSVMAGSAGFFLPAMSVGCAGAICSLANVLPFDMCNLQALFNEGLFERAQQLQWRMLQPNEAVTTKYGVAGLKAVLKQYYGIDTGSVRSPLRNLTPTEVETCLAAFKQNGFFTDSSTETTMASNRANF